MPIVSRIVEVRTYVEDVFNHLGEKFDDLGLSLLSAVEDGNTLIKSVLLDKADKGFIGICFHLKKEMEYLINTFPVYISESKDLTSKIGELKDIGEYNKYI
jgi:hypothetical protein